MAGYCDNFSMIDGDSSSFSMNDGGDKFVAFPGLKGEDGTTFYPHVSADGIISWTNDGGKPNPDPVNIKGADGQSAYEAAVEAGFTGTEAEFNTYLSGIGVLTQEVADQKSAIDDLSDLVDRKAGMLVDTASGAIASFVPDSTIDNLLGVSVAVEPVQDLHGYDNPWPAGGGKNKLKITATTTTINGITYTVNGDGTIVANGTASGNSTFVLASGTGIFNLDSELILNGSVGGFGNNVRIRFGAANSAASYDDFGNGVTIPQISDLSTRYAYVQITILSGTTVSNIVFKPMVRLASVTDATFAPYSNICSITGHDEVTVTRTGKNLFDVSLGQYKVLNPTTGELGADNPIRFTSALTDLPDGTYTFSFGSNMFIIGIAFYDKSGNFKRYDAKNFSPTAQTFSAEREKIRLYCGSAQNRDDLVNGLSVGQLELGSTATAYEPYQGNEYTIQLGQTVYGGTLDVTQGKLTVNMKKVTYDGSNDEFWSRQSSDSNRFYIDAHDLKKIYDYRNDLIADKLKTVENQESMREFTITGYCDSSGAYPDQNWIYIQHTTETTPEELKSWLHDNPVTVVYTLATPIEIQLAPVTIATIAGQNNNVWADAGDVSVEYAADLKHYIDSKIAAAVAALS